ncbi:MAG: hypothetical protein WCE79_10320 [Xanthobacteraceae bacterium]
MPDISAHCVETDFGAAGAEWDRRVEVDLPASVDELGGDVIIDRQDEVSKPVIDTELNRVSKMFARATGELALNPQDTDIRATPVSRRCKIVEVTQEKPLRTRSWRSL